MTVLVLTTVHFADDTRIRERLIRTLATEFSVIYATRTPGPADHSGLTWRPLRGGRARRWWGALRALLAGSWDVAVIHDPELIPAGVIARALRRRPIVFDVHEDLAAQIVAKDWIPALLRPLVRRAARVLYRIAERTLQLTLAEDSYRRLFRGDHPVFPNFPRYEGWPDPVSEGDGSVVYVGDVRPARGVSDAARACARAGVPFRVIGPSDPVFSTALQQAGGEVRLQGRHPNPETLDLMRTASAGISPLRPLPNYVDSIPTKVIEYLAMGLPVVATDLPGTRQVLDGFGAVWIVPSGDIDAMATAVREAVRSESRAAALARATEVRSSFRWPESAVLAHYRSLGRKHETESPGDVHQDQGQGNS
jgi:glycosyltransferase involved in cell wall biosynthesis